MNNERNAEPNTHPDTLIIEMVTTAAMQSNMQLQAALLARVDGDIDSEWAAELAHAQVTGHLLASIKAWLRARSLPEVRAVFADEDREMLRTAYAGWARYLQHHTQWLPKLNEHHRVETASSGVATV
jgi:hypothetical protein